MQLTIHSLIMTSTCLTGNWISSTLPWMTLTDECRSGHLDSSLIQPTHVITFSKPLFLMFCLALFANPEASMA